MRNIKRFICALLSVFLCCSVFALPAYASWKDDFTATYDDEYLYLHAERSSGVYNWYSMQPYSLEIKSTGGKLQVQLQPGDNQNLIVHNQIGYAVVPGASGSYSCDPSGSGQWDVRIPLSDLERHSEKGNINISMDWAGGNGGSHVEKIAKPVTDTDSSEGSEPDSSDGSGSQPGKNENGIVIDGYYDDWENIPYTIFTYHGNNDTMNHEVSVVKDDTNIYVHIKLSEYYSRQIPLDAMFFNVDGKGQVQVCLRYTDDKYNTNGLYDLQPGRHGELSPFLVGRWTDLGDAYVTIPETGNSDEMEYSINIEQLEQAMGWPKGTVNNSGKITVTLPNLGYQQVVVTGTSTAPMIGVTLSLVAVATVLYIRKYRRRKVQP